jgi:hypothetical protein
VSWFSDFIVTPGAGGLGAVVAALIVGSSAVVVSRHRHQEAGDALANTVQKEALERWWDRFVWLVGVGAESLPIEGRVAFLAALLQDAKDLAASELVTAAQGYGVVLDGLIAEALKSGGQSKP